MLAVGRTRSSWYRFHQLLGRAHYSLTRAPLKQLIQYATKIINWHLRNGDPSSPLAQRLANLAGPVSDFRILLRYYGLIPLVQWIRYSEKNPAPTKKLQWLTRAQNFVNVCYYPLEHAYWLGLHQVIPMTPATRDKIGMWSCRFWAGYVVC
jgi:hypothetical protein